jgi:serine protease AprX
MRVQGDQTTRTSAIVAALLAFVAALAPAGHFRAQQMRTVVVMKDTAGDTRPESALRSVGGRVLHSLDVIDGFIASVPEAGLATLAHAAGVRSLTPNQRLALQSQYGQDSGVASAVYTDVVRANKTWAAGHTGGGVTVAVVDTGVDTSGDLAGQVLRAVDFTSEGDGADRYGHGTFVAGLIAGTGADSGGQIEGVAPGAKLVSLKISGADGATDVTLVLEALEWLKDFATTYNIRVVNLSLGFASQQSYAVDPLDYAVERLWDAGITVVTAAGNGGNSPGTILAPGNDPFVITVGSSNDRTTVNNNDDKLATFSSSGPTVDGMAKPDLLAPGRSIVSSRSPGSTVDLANPGSAIGDVYGKGSGTSFSTGIVSGVAALVLSKSPWLSPNQVKQRLTGSARSIPGGGSAATGAGVVDAWGATMSTVTGTANAGVVPSAGGGSLQATRGPACLRDTTGECMSDAAADAALGYDPSALFAPTWAGSQWVGSQWVGSQWAGNQWVGSQWVGSQWVGSQWVGSQWVSPVSATAGSGA